MRATTAFAAPTRCACEAKRVGFVVWTIPSPCAPCGERGCPPSSLYTFSVSDGAWLGITSRRTGKGFTDFDGCHPAVSVPGSPLGQQVPSLSVCCRSRPPLTLIILHEADPAPITREHVNRQHIKHVPIQQIQDCEIKIGRVIRTSHHNAPVCLRATRITGIEGFRLVTPRAFHLETKQSAALFNREVICKAVPHWPENPKPPLKEFGHHGRFRNVSFELGVQLTMSPTSYLTAPPRSRGRGIVAREEPKSRRRAKRLIAAGWPARKSPARQAWRA